MTPEVTPTDGSMKQPRRYLIRKLHDVDGLTQRDIASKLGISAATVNRDLDSTVAPAGRTPGGAVYYPPGRFNEDPEYQEFVEELMRDMPQASARRHAARVFAGPPSKPSPLMRGQIERIRTEEEKQRLIRAFDRGEDEAAA